MTTTDIKKLNLLYGCPTEVELADKIDPECSDENDLCQDWKEHGGCHKFRGYMEAKCAKSCGFCQKVF